MNQSTFTRGSCSLEGNHRQAGNADDQGCMHTRKPASCLDGTNISIKVNACSGHNNNTMKETCSRIQDIRTQNETVPQEEFFIREKEYDQFVDRHVDHTLVERHMRLISRARGNWS